MIYYPIYYNQQLSYPHGPKNWNPALAAVIIKLSGMFYLLRHLMTTLNFPSSEMDRVSSPGQVWDKLRDKFQGRCTLQHGIIVQITSPGIEDLADPTQLLPLARIDDQFNCSFEVQFAAIAFKAEKNDLIRAKVTQLSPDCIVCYIGPVEVRLPRSKIDACLQYEKDLNCYRHVARNYRVDVGSLLMCQCFDTRVEMGAFVSIIAQLPEAIVRLNIEER